MAVLIGLGVLEGEILELPLDLPHAQPMREWCVDLYRLACDALLFIGRQVLESAHVVEPIRELDDDDPDILGHGHEHLANVLGLLLLHRPGATELRQLGDAIHQARHVATEALLDLGDGEVRILGNIVQECRRQGLGVHLKRCQVVAHGDRVRDVRLAGAAQLAFMGARRHLVCAADQALVDPGPMLLRFGDDLIDRTNRLARSVATARDPLHDGRR